VLGQREIRQRLGVLRQFNGLPVQLFQIDALPHGRGESLFGMRQATSNLAPPMRHRLI
jgi:hypothetical protein